MNFKNNQSYRIIYANLFEILKYFCVVHTIEPYFHWRNLYIASEDESSPFFDREYSEFEFGNHVYNYYIHPQWDDMESPTLYLKILYVDYDIGYTIIEFIGEWNDAIENDIMTLKRDVIDEMIGSGIDKFILIGENILNFHASDDCYYEEWIDDIDEGWVVLVNFHEHVEREMQDVGIDQYFIMGGEMDEIEWRTYVPQQFYKRMLKIVENRFQ